jgi:hypothetical protein
MFRNLVAFSLIVLFTHSSVVNAFEPADSSIKAAWDDILKAEQQVSDDANLRPTVINRTLRFLTIARGRLDESPNQSHDSWRQADTRYQALVARLNALKEPQSATTNTAPETRAGATTVTSPQPEQEMISQDRARISRLVRDIQSAIETLDSGGTMPFQDATYVEKANNAAKRYRESLQRFQAFDSDPEVITATAELERFEAMIVFGTDQANAVKDRIGDVQARLAVIQDTIFKQRPPVMIEAPFRSDTVSTWVSQAASVRSSAVAFFQELQEIKQVAWLPNNPGTVGQGAAFDTQDVDRLLSVLSRDVQDIDATLTQFANDIDAGFQQVSGSVAWYDALDPANPAEQTNAFLASGALERSMADFEANRQLAHAIATFDDLLQRPSLAERQEMLERIDRLENEYLEKRAQALTLVRMPEPKSDDADLLAVATDTLNLDKYEVGEIVRLVINADKRHLEKESTEVEYDKIDVGISGDVTLSGTGTTTRYAWDEYQVATAEPVGDKHYIYYNTLRYFTAGGATTPLIQWILAARIQGSEIPLENIDK